jgi:hypothetical protein
MRAPLDEEEIPAISSAEWPEVCMDVAGINANLRGVGTWGRGGESELSLELGHLLGAVAERHR